jgi:hypothetical protein
MKKKLTFLLLTITFSTFINAQSISITHLFAGEKIPYLSKGNEKLGWVSKSGNYFASNLMDSMQNIVTTVDTNLVSITNGFPANGGVSFCGSTVNNNDELIGLFYDWACWSDSNMIFGPFLGTGCYFLYDFVAQQKHYLYFNSSAFVHPQIVDLDIDYHLNWIGDTLIISIQFSDQNTSSGNHGYCLKFLNYQLIQQGQLSVNNNVVDVFIDPTNKLNQLYDNVMGGFWLQNDGVNYNNDLTPNVATYFGDAFVKGNDMYILQNHFSFIGESDSIKHYNGTTIQATMASPMTGVYTYKVMCKDHAGRLWVATKDSVYMYNGTIWLSFGFGGIDLANQLINSSPMKSFIEYKSNCFALSFADDLLTVGNGMLLFCYSDSTTVTNAKSNSLAFPATFYPNPATHVISSNNLMPNDQVMMYNILGEVVTQETVMHNSLNIDISAFPAGIYFIEVVQENQSKSIQKIVISKN